MIKINKLFIILPIIIFFFFLGDIYNISNFCLSKNKIFYKLCKEIISLWYNRTKIIGLV